ncbi:MAG TPA: hypothetical protein VNS60_02395 [Solirubrobacterales bacterium]|nr:hypothetical protein [Solirubrobacterales bacterium]
MQPDWGSSGRARPSSRVVILNGPAGVGKSTTARALADTVANGACIHGDDLRDFIVARQDGAVSTGLGYRNGASLAQNFVNAGYELVVFEYVFETARGIEEFRQAYQSSVPAHFFTLWAPLEVVLKREASWTRRQQRQPLGERVEACYRRMQANLGALGPVVPTGESQVSEVVADLLCRCDRREGMLPPAATESIALAS